MYIINITSSYCLYQGTSATHIKTITFVGLGLARKGKTTHEHLRTHPREYTWKLCIYAVRLYRGSHVRELTIIRERLNISKPQQKLLGTLLFLSCWTTFLQCFGQSSGSALVHNFLPAFTLFTRFINCFLIKHSNSSPISSKNVAFCL